MNLKIITSCLLIISITIVIADGSRYMYEKASVDGVGYKKVESVSTLASINKSPEINFLPKNLSFSKDSWKSGGYRRVDLTIYNPENITMLNASIKLKIPPGWEYNPEIENNVINFDPDDVLFWVSSFNGSYAHTWIDLKPGPYVHAGMYAVCADSNVSFLNSGLLNNILFKKTYYTRINISMIDDTESEHNIIKDNIWIFIMISAICGSITLILNHNLREYLKSKVHKLSECFKNN